MASRAAHVPTYYLLRPDIPLSLKAGLFGDGSQVIEVVGCRVTSRDWSLLPGTRKPTTLMETVADCSEVTLGCLSSALNPPGVRGIHHSLLQSAAHKWSSVCDVAKADVHACLWLFRSLCCDLLVTVTLRAQWLLTSEHILFEASHWYLLKGRTV